MIKDLLIDLMVIGGAALISYGAFLIGEEFGFIVSGIFLFTIGMGLTKARAKARDLYK